jgi:hypothetical protein
VSFPVRLVFSDETDSLNFTLLFSVAFFSQHLFHFVLILGDEDVVVDFWIVGSQLNVVAIGDVVGGFEQVGSDSLTIESEIERYGCNNFGPNDLKYGVMHLKI